MHTIHFTCTCCEEGTIELEYERPDSSVGLSGGLLVPDEGEVLCVVCGADVGPMISAAADDWSPPDPWEFYPDREDDEDGA